MYAQSSSTVAPIVVAAPRVNLAGLCLWCEQRGCRSLVCAERHAASVWIVCPDCHGLTWLDNDERCPSCTLGITEIAPTSANRAALAETQSITATAPISVPPVLVSVALPRCLGCGHRTATVHQDCAVDINPGSWVPCGICLGLRIDGDGFECQECCGAGFIPMTGHDTLAERAGDVPPWQEATDTQTYGQACGQV